MIQGNKEQTNNGKVEKYCYENKPLNCTIYGGMYQWAEAVQYQKGASNTTSPNPAFSGNVRGICPAGWHLPSDVEWDDLYSFLGDPDVSGGALKSTKGLWESPNTGAMNSSGFSALPGGFRDYLNDRFYDIGKFAYFWSSSEASIESASVNHFFYSSSSTYGNFYPKEDGLSVRCIQD
jgi:uncharacterized protein (TIGR02145 family)